MRSLILVAALAATLACGTNKDSPTSPTSTPAPSTQTVTGTVSSLGIVQHPVTIARSGNMTLALTWGTSADLDLYLTNTTCNTYPPSSCQILAASDGLAATERITRSVTAGETFKAWVDNFSATPQNYSLTITIQ